MVDIPQYDMRFSEERDLSYLKKWVEDPSLLQWFPMTSQQEVEEALRCWIGFCRFKSSLTATCESKPVGIATLFLMPYKKVAHHCLLKIAVDPDMHRKGIGRDLIKNAKHLAASYFRLESIHAEIFENNPLIYLLEQMGFIHIMRQEGYVKSEGLSLARILMECDVRGGV